MIRWNETNLPTAFDPNNRRGRNPVCSTTPAQKMFGARRDALNEPNVSNEADGGASSSNFQLIVPVLSLPSRGLDLSLNL
jgi:hypothetical protein